MSDYKGQPADEEPYGAAKRLDQEAEEKLVQRLYYRQVELAKQREEERMAMLRRLLPPTSVRAISKEEEERLVSRMYDQQLERLHASQKEREKRLEEEVHQRDIKMDSSAIEEQVKRMYEEERSKSQQRRKQLDERYYPARETKKIPKTTLTEAVNRLYHVDYEKRDAELFEKYVYPFDPKVSRISKADVAAMADRLSTTKGSA